MRVAGTARVGHDGVTQVGATDLTLLGVEGMGRATMCRAVLGYLVGMPGRVVMLHGGGLVPLRFSRETVLATNGMVALAGLQNGRSLTASAVAGQAGADTGEMGDVLARLERAGLVERDPSTDQYRLRRRAASVSLYEVAAAMGESFELCHLLLGTASGRSTRLESALESVSNHVKADVIALFKSRTVGELAAPQI